jgi:hypothetical protein
MNKPQTPLTRESATQNLPTMYREPLSAWYRRMLDAKK